MTSVFGTRDVRAPKKKKRCKVRWGREDAEDPGQGILRDAKNDDDDDEEMAKGNDLWLAALAKAASQFHWFVWSSDACSPDAGANTNSSKICRMRRLPNIRLWM